MFLWVCCYIQFCTLVLTARIILPIYSSCDGLWLIVWILVFECDCNVFQKNHPKQNTNSHGTPRKQMFLDVRTPVAGWTCLRVLGTNALRWIYFGNRISIPMSGLEENSNRVCRPTTTSVKNTPPFYPPCFPLFFLSFILLDFSTFHPNL